MARSGHVGHYFEAVHPVNGTPYRALALLAGVALVLPCVMLGFEVKMSEIMDYLMQIASFGFLGGYLAVCIAAPIYLARKSKLGLRTVLIAVGTVSALCAVFFMSLYPVPDAPWRYSRYGRIGKGADCPSGAAGRGRSGAGTRRLVRRAWRFVREMSPV